MIKCGQLGKYETIVLSKISGTPEVELVTVPCYNRAQSTLLIEKRVNNAEEVSEKWKLYMAIVKHETNSYKDGKIYIEARRYDTSTQKICSSTVANQKLFPHTRTNNTNSSSLLNNHRKRFKVDDDVDRTNRHLCSSISSECSNDELTSMITRPSTEYSFEKMIEITEGQISSTRKVSYQNSTNKISFCGPSSENKSRCLPVYYNCNQQDLRVTGLFGGAPNVSVTTKSPSVKNNTVQYTSNPSRETFQLFSNLHQNQSLESHQDRLIKYSHPQGILEKPKEIQGISSNTSSQSIVGNNTLHAALSPLILANQIFQDFQQPQESQISSTYQDHLQQTTLNHELHRRTISNLQSILPDFSTNQKCSQGSGQSTSYAVQNTTNVANQFSQIPNLLSVYQDHSQVLLTKEIPKRQSFELKYYIPSQSASVSSSNSVGTNTCSTQHFDITQPPGDGNHSHRDPSLKEMIVDGSTKVSCTEKSVSSEQCRENESSAPTTNIDDLWLDRMADLFDRLDSVFSNTCKIACEMHESLVQSAKTFKCIENVSVNLRKLKTSEGVGTPKEVAVEAQKMAEAEQVEMKGKQISDVDMAENKKKVNSELEKSDGNNKSSNDDKNTDKEDDDDKDKNKNKDEDKDKNADKHKDENKDMNEKASKETRGCIRTFVLPREYDRNDTKWTLKYRKRNSKPGFVELVENSRVFINAVRLAYCKRVATDSKMLARMLLVEIFTQSALSVCSLTGARSNVFDITRTNVRPGLDEHARMVIFQFVEEHARLKRWDFDTQSIINSMRSKIHKIRAKHGQTT